MPPRNTIDAVTLHSTQQWPSGRWIPMRFEVNSWVTLNPDPTSAWGRDSQRYPVNSPQYLWKAQVLGFEFGGESGQLVSRVKVRHAYERRQLYLDPGQPRPRLPCNYLFPSFFEDWVDPESIVGLIVVMHAELGELIHGDRTHRELYDASIFFYRWIYVPPSGIRLYGLLEPIELPSFNSPTWPLPDMMSSEGFRAKMWKDFRNSLKPNTGSRRSHLQWWMPITVYIDLFASARTRVRSSTLYTIKDIDECVFNDLMDPGWYTKTTDNGDIIRCTVALPSVVFRYHIARQTLYVNFFFTRERLVGQEWIAMDQTAATRPLVQLQCHASDTVPPTSMTFTVGTDWPVSHLRNEVQILMGDEAPADFIFYYNDGTATDCKVNRRRETSMTVADLLPPVVLKIRSC